MRLGGIVQMRMTRLIPKALSALCRFFPAPRPSSRFLHLGEIAKMQKT
jgi:hypothetical protein